MIKIYKANNISKKGVINMQGENKKLHEIKKPDVVGNFIQWFKHKFNKPIFIYPASDDIEKLRSHDSAEEELKEILEINYNSLINPIEFKITENNNKFEYSTSANKKKREKILSNKLLKKILSKITLKKDTHKYFPQRFSNRNLQFVDVLISKINTMKDHISSYSENFPNPVDISDYPYVKRAKRLHSSLKKIVKTASLLEKELGPRKQDNDYILERKANLSTTSSIWEFFCGNSRYQDVTNADVDKDEYAIKTLISKSKNYRNQLVFYLDNIPGAEQNKLWNLLSRRLERLKILLQKWIEYFTVKMKPSDVRNSILNDLSKIIVKLTNNDQPSSKDIANKEEVQKMAGDMDNLKEIEDFIKDWSNLKITSKLWHAIKTGGVSKVFNHIIDRIGGLLGIH